MSTPNIVPRSDGEGGLGTSAKSWDTLYVGTATADTVAGGTVTADTLTGGSGTFDTLDGGAATADTFSADTITGGAFLPETADSTTLGASGNAFGNVYSNEVTADTITGGTGTFDTLSGGALTCDTLNGIVPSTDIRFIDFNEFVSYTASTTTFTVTAKNNPFTGSTSDLSITISTASSGAGGVDTGSIASDTWYYVWVCYGTSGTTAILSLSYESPTLPSGYDSQYVRVGSILTNSSSLLYYIYQRSNRAEIFVDGTVIDGSYPTMASGSTSNVLTAVDITGYCPTEVIKTITIQVGAESFSGNNAVYVCANSNGTIFAGSVGYATIGQLTFATIVPEGDYIYYYSGDSGGVLNAIGWEDNLL